MRILKPHPHSNTLPLARPHLLIVPLPLGPWGHFHSNHHTTIMINKNLPDTHPPDEHHQLEVQINLGGEWPGNDALVIKGTYWKQPSL